MTRAVHVPYTVEQDEDGVFCAHAQLRPGVGANGEGDTPEAAVADLREALERLIAEFATTTHTGRQWRLPSTRPGVSLQAARKARPAAGPGSSTRGQAPVMSAAHPVPAARQTPQPRTKAPAWGTSSGALPCA